MDGVAKILGNINSWKEEGGFVNGEINHGQENNHARIIQSLRLLDYNYS